MLLQEPVKAAIWDSLNHYSYADAIFLAERLFAEVSNNEALYLLATAYYRAGKLIQAYSLLQKHDSPTPQCRYLMARCCMEINKLSEAEEVLAGNIYTKNKSHDELESEFGSMSCHVFSLLGAMYSKTERMQKAIECYKKCLKINPLLWSAFEKLCSLGDRSDPTSVFHVPNHSQSTPTTQLNQIPSNVGFKVQPPILNITDVLTPVSDGTQTSAIQEGKLQTPQPQNVISYSLSVTPENFTDTPPNLDVLHCPKTKRKPKPRLDLYSNDQPQVIGSCKTLFFSPMTPSFGLMPVETPSPHEPQHSGLPFITPSPTALTDSNNMRAPKKPVTRSQYQPPIRKQPVFSVYSNSANTQEQPSGIQNNPPPVRRSSRLFGSNNSSSVKENNKSQSNKTRFQSPRAMGRKSKTRNSKSQQELNENNKVDLNPDTKPTSNPEVPTQNQIMQMQHQSLSGILHLLQSMGKAVQALSQFDCKKAIELFQELPVHQYNTGYVMCQVGRAHFEMADYQKAERVFSQVRLLEPYHFEGMEIYSTALWHLQKEVELSALAQELSDMDKNSPEGWCATGNCFSLQKEHDIAIKFFQRAIQVDPNFAYAYTLLGHEYVFTEELDKAMSCFRNAIRVDSRHYNAWYGVGMIYYKQEKFSLAEVHFRKALSINPQSSALLCHIGVVQHAQQKSESALVTLNKAIATDPKNPLCKFHRASILFASDKHKEALAELEQLKQIVPKESLVYFLIGKVHKKLGNTHLALMNFSWAMDLDPKGINNQIKEAIDKRYVTEDDESLAQLDETVGIEDPIEDPSVDFQLQAIESDESL